MYFKHNIKDVNSYGIDGGFNGFIYYKETHEFAIKNRKQILLLLEYWVENGDYNNEIELVSSFKCIDFDREDMKDLIKYMAGGKLEQCSVTNALAWFAAEEVCRMFED